jgi:cytochrome bd-type quinol oxidase subunit 2
MMTKIFSLILATAALCLVMLFAPAPTIGTAAAACPAGANQASCQACEGIGLTGGDCDSKSNGINKLLNKVINIVSAIVGFVAVVMIIVGGFKYITSGGDSNKVAAAKNTLVYALVGLVIVALAQFLVHVVLNKADNATTATMATPAAIVLYSHQLV